MTATRRLVAIVVADMARYSGLMDADEDSKGMTCSSGYCLSNSWDSSRTNFTVSYQPMNIGMAVQNNARYLKPRRRSPR